MRTGQKDFLKVVSSDRYKHKVYLTFSPSSIFHIYCERKNLRKGRDAYTLMCYIDSQYDGSFTVSECGQVYKDVKGINVELMNSVELFTESEGKDLLYAEVQFLEDGVMKKSKVHLTTLRDLFSEYGYYKYKSKSICQDYMI